MIQTSDKAFKKSIVFGVIVLLATSFLWGTTFVSGRVLVSELSVSSILFYRVVISCLVAALFFFKILRTELGKALKSKEMALFSIVGALATIIQTEALKFSSASNVAFLSAMFVVFVPIIDYVFYGKKLKNIFYFAVLLSVAGIYLISYGFSVPKGLSLGNLFALLSAVGYAYYFILLEKIPKEFSSSTIVFHFFMTMGIMCFLFCLFIGGFGTIRTICKPIVFLNILSLALIGGIIPYMLMVVGQKVIAPHFATLIYNFEPVFATILAYTLLNESFHTSAILGCIAIFASLTIGAKTR